MSTTLSIAALADVAICQVDNDEFEAILHTLMGVVSNDMGDLCVHVGKNAAGAIVVLMNSMSGVHAVASAIF